MGKKKLPQDTPPKQPTDPTPGVIHLAGEIPHPGCIGKKRHGKLLRLPVPGNNVIPFQSQVTQDDIVEELALRAALLEKRTYIREILETGGKVEPGPHSAKLIKASWVVGGKALEIR